MINKKQRIKLAVDILLAATLLLLMPYELIGQEFHEIAGVIMLIVLLWHHILNVQWLRSIFKRKYTLFRIVQTVLNLLIFVCMIALVFSGLFVSQTVFTFFNLGYSEVFARIHMLSAFWGFVLMSIHIGMNWSTIVGRIKKKIKWQSNRFSIAGWLMATIAAALGVYKFKQYDILGYLTLSNHFYFIDFEKPPVITVIDYLLMMSLFIIFGYILSILARRKTK